MGEQSPLNIDFNAEIEPSVLGMTRVAIETEIAKNGVCDLWLTALNSASRSYELEAQQLGRTVDDLLQLFGVDVQSAAEQLVGVASNYSKSEGWKGNAEQVTAARREDKPLGILLHNYVLEAMPIEDEADGVGEAKLTVRLAENLYLELHGFGDFWTDHTYRHPVTGQLLTDGAHAVESAALMEAGDDAEALDSRVAYDLVFDARLSTGVIE